MEIIVQNDSLPTRESQPKPIENKYQKYIIEGLASGSILILTAYVSSWREPLIFYSIL